MLNALTLKSRYRTVSRCCGKLSSGCRCRLTVKIRKGDSVVFTYLPYPSWRYGTVVSFDKHHDTITIIDHAAGGEFRTYKASKIRNFQFWGE